MRQDTAAILPFQTLESHQPGAILQMKKLELLCPTFKLMELTIIGEYIIAKKWNFVKSILIYFSSVISYPICCLDPLSMIGNDHNITSFPIVCMSFLNILCITQRLFGLDIETCQTIDIVLFFISPFGYDMHVVFSHFHCLMVD